MRREAGGHENFFIAKLRDSESAQRTFRRTRRRATRSRTHRSLNARLMKILAAQTFPATLTIEARGFSRAIRIVMRTPCRVVEPRASHASTSRRQHFLKRDAVFFNVLVYSEWVHFDSRVHAAIKSISLHQEGNMAKKAKKAKKAKSAVKKTAKKTRKVAKKKK
jgi:hypothetical protein